MVVSTKLERVITCIYFQNKNVYTRSFEDISHLAKSSHPSPDNHRTPTQRPGNKSIKSVPQHQTGLDRIYRGCKPTRPMHLSKYGLERDPITRHGMQLIECHKNEMRGMIIISVNLTDLYAEQLYVWYVKYM